MRTGFWVIVLALWLVAVGSASPQSGGRGLSRPEMYLGLGHTEPVGYLTWSPDGKTLATRSSDETVILWDAAERRPRATLTNHNGLGVGVVWSPDGKMLAVADGRTAVLWDAGTGRRRATLAGGVGRLDVLGWSRDGRTLITVDRHEVNLWDPEIRRHLPVPRGNVVLWDVGKGRRRARLRINGELLDMALSPDRRTLAVFGDNPEPGVTLWDTTTWRRRRTLERRRDIGMLVWSPDSRVLAGIGNEEVTLWDTYAGRRQANVPFGADVYAYDSLAWSPDGKWVTASGMLRTGGSRIGLWDVATGRRKAQVTVYATGVPLAWSPNGKTLAGPGDKGLVLRNPGTLTKRATLPVPGDMLFGWSPDGGLLATAGPGGTLVFWDGLTGQRRGVLPCHLVPVSRLAWSPDGRMIATGTAGYSFQPYRPADPAARVVLWDAQSGKPRDALSVLPRGIYDLAWRPDGSAIGVAAGVYGTPPGPDGSGPPPQGWLKSAAVLWRLGPGRRRLKLAGPAALIAWSPDGTTLATGSPSGSVLLWDGTTGERRAALPPVGVNIWALAWSPDGKSLATPGTGEGRYAYLLWDMALRKIRARLLVPPISYSGLAWSPDGGTIATTVDDRFLIVWDAATAAPRQTLVLTAAPRQAGGFIGSAGWSTLAWRPDGRMLAAGLPRQGLIKLWRVDTGQLAAILAGPALGADLLQWSPDGQTLACAYTDHTVVLWDPERRSRRATLRGHTGPITALAWSPDGRMLATGSQDGSLRLWSAATGKELAAFYSLDGGKEWLAVTPEGYFAASAHGAEVIQWRRGGRLWPVAKFRRRFERPDLVRRALGGWLVNMGGR